MLVQVRTIKVKEGYANEIVNRFSQPGPMEQSEGFIDASVLVKKENKSDEEVMIIVRWESEEAWRGWHRSDAHLAGHRQRKEKGHTRPDYILDVSHASYELQAVRSKD